MLILCILFIAWLGAPFLNGVLFSALTKLSISNNVKIFFGSYVRVLLLVAIMATILAHFEKDFVMLSVAYLTGMSFFTFINGEKYFVSCTLSQQAVTIQYLTSRFTTKTVVLPIGQITGTKLSAGKGWYGYPHRYTITFNDEEGKFYILSPITSSDFFYLVDNTDVNNPKPAEV